jgi:prepilin-type N-terminal cleavage/methylation domain-containing protein
MRNNTRKYGFTLLELSIVLVIIGLIVGGVVAGQELIQSAKINRAVSEIQAFRSSIYTFRSKYNALAGDFSRAYQYWGAPCGADTSGAADSCNGNGDGKAPTSPIPIYEGALTFWHLYLSGMNPINNYTPNRADITARLQIGGTVFPYAPVDGSFYYFFFNPPDLQHWFEIRDNNGRGVMSPSQIKVIDDKLDDGIADKGVIRAVRGINYAGTECLSVSQYTGNYVLSSTLPACYMRYDPGF